MPLPALPALPALPELPLPPGVRSRQVDNNNGLSVQAWSASELAQLPSYHIMEQSAHCTIPE